MELVSETGNEKKRQDTFQIIVFKLGEEEYALQIDQIKEVVITPGITRMPQTPGYIKGVANIRGNIIAIIDLEEKFNLQRLNNQETSNNYTLVVESDDLKVGILVREVPNTLTISSSSFDESVGIINEAQSESNYIKGIVKADKRLIILIDIFKVIDQEAVNLKKNVA